MMEAQARAIRFKTAEASWRQGFITQLQAAQDVWPGLTAVAVPKVVPEAAAPAFGGNDSLKATDKESLTDIMGGGNGNEAVQDLRRAGV
jgi:hypothetical protein